MKCLYCDSNYYKHSILSALIEKDKLCTACRKELKINKKVIEVNDLKVKTYFDYDSIFKSILLQYKECYDEALSEVFLYELKNYLRIRYFDYHIIYVPSSKRKLDQRGFNHLEKMFSCLNLKEAKGLRQINDYCQQDKNIIDRKKMLNNYIYEGNRYKKVLLVDDVLTSGASIYGSYKAIKGHFDKTECLVLGMVQKNEGNAFKLINK